MDLYNILQTLSNLEEGTMTAAEKHKTGPKFTGYWKGTDAGTPGDKMVGSMEEDTTGAVLGGLAGAAITKSPTGALAGSQIGSEIEDNLEEELMSAWEQHLEEYGADATSTAGTAATGTDQAKTAQELANAQKNVNTLKTAGIDIPSVAQASQSAVKAADNPSAPLTAQDKTLAMGIGQQLQQALAKADPNQMNQIAAAMKKIKSGT